MNTAALNTPAFAAALSAADRHTTMDRPAGTASPDRFRQGMRRLVGGVTVVAARLADGSRAGLAATAVCSVSAEPAALLVCVNQSSTLGRALAVDLPFSVNVLAAGHEALARAFGGMAGLGQHERFSLGAWHDGTSGAPRLADAQACFECRVTHLVACGSHQVVIGQVEHVTLGHATTGALAYHEGAFHRIE